MAKLLYQGHGSFRITSAAGAVAYVDPFAGEGYDLPADLILVTHEHYDHTETGLVTQKSGCVVMRGSAMTDGKRYGSGEHAGFKVRAVPAYNKNHPRGECVGFVIEIDGVTVYAAGDTSRTDYMEKLAFEKIDYALFPTDGVFNMDAAAASECAALVNARFSIPIHTKPGALFSEEVAANFSAKGKLVLRPGEEIELK